MSNAENSLNRRRFLAQAGGAAAALALVHPTLARAEEPAADAPAIRLGVIGCGGRGNWIADLFLGSGGYQVVAACDYFAEQVNAFGDRLGVDAAHRFTGLSGYKRLLELKDVDAVVIETPPYFHPEQAAAAVEAGRHVYVAKPVAVDAPGCRTIGESGRKASEKVLVFLVDFQTRADPFYIEALAKVHAGALGEMAFGEATYHCDETWQNAAPWLEGKANDPEARLRAWGLDRAYSGDIITEQNIHALDVMSWIMNSEPLRASGVRARKVRRHEGDVHDCFSVTFEYPNEVGVAFSSRQFNGYGSRPDGIRNRMFGSRGVLETAYGGEVLIRGEEFYRGGSSPGIFQDGAVANIAEFRRCIHDGDASNPTVAASVRSNLVTILGRQAADEQRTVAWSEMASSDDRLEPLLKGLRD